MTINTMLNCRRALAFGVLGILVGCAAPGTGVDRPAASAAWPERTEVADARGYRVDRAASMLHVRVDAAGSMARFGHSHIIGGAVIEGTIQRAPDLTDSALDLVVHVPDLVVDDPAWRRVHGLDAELDPAAIEGTRTNLLGPRVLDAERYPLIAIRSVAISGPDWAPVVTLRVRLHDQVREFAVPITLHEDAGTLVASGHFAFDHADFGLEPFSALGGSLRVSERIETRFRIVAGADRASGEVARR
ncbi:MAG: YceI family protein [Wenzhouxiangellaceae bacterium]|nr:YceI family protein [Wenzhouxiangellaceae bacterium]